MATIRILIVDDEEPFLRNLESYLGSFGDEFEVLTATTDEDALTLVNEVEIQVLLTDVRLPGMDGIELVRHSIEIHPSLRVIVMTAFSSPDIRKTALREGALRFIEKPLDLKELRTTLTELGEDEDGWSGLVGGLELFDLTQLMSLSGKTKIMRVTYRRKKGTLVFDAGQLNHASCGKIKGEKAFFEMAGWEGGRFQELASNQRSKYKANITSRTTHLMMEAARLKDEAAAGMIPDTETTSGQDIDLDLDQLTEETDEGIVRTERKEEDRTMANIKELLQPIADVQGFMGVGVFTDGGEMIESVETGKIDTNSIGIYANNVLLNAQKATDEMGVGRGNFVTINAPQATLLVRCLNEATDFAGSKDGKAHFHTVVILEGDGNVGMAKLMLEKAVGKIAEALR